VVAAQYRRTTHLAACRDPAARRRPGRSAAPATRRAPPRPSPSVPGSGRAG
jgi:hypothetical protein